NGIRPFASSIALQKPFRCRCGISSLTRPSDAGDSDSAPSVLREHFYTAPSKATFVAPSVRRLLGALLLSASAIACAKDTRFEPVYRAANTVHAATQGGVDFKKFSDLVSALSTEEAIALDHALTPDEKQLALEYQVLTDIYRDSLVVWRAKIFETPPEF